MFFDILDKFGLYFLGSDQFLIHLLDLVVKFHFLIHEVGGIESLDAFFIVINLFAKTQLFNDLVKQISYFFVIARLQATWLFTCGSP